MFLLKQNTPSYRRMPVGTFTFEVQRFKVIAEYRSGRLEPKTFSWSMVVGGNPLVELCGGEGGEVGFTRQAATPAADSIFDAAFLPGGMGVAEIGWHPELLIELVMLCELGAIVEGDGTSERSRE